jgi:hypothetical protein
MVYASSVFIGPLLFGYKRSSSTKNVEDPPTYTLILQSSIPF